MNKRVNMYKPANTTNSKHPQKKGVVYIRKSMKTRIPIFGG